MLVPGLKSDGLCHGGGGWIKIRKNLKARLKARTLFHEMAHLMLEEFDVNLSDEDEEKVVLAMEVGCSGFAKDHQKVFQSMIKEMGKL